MKEIQLWYRDICDKTINIKNKPKRFNFKTHKQNKMVSLLKTMELLNQKLMKRNYVLDKVLKIVEIKFITFIFSNFITKFKFISIAINEDVMLTKTNGYDFFKSDHYGLFDKGHKKMDSSSMN